MRMPSMVSELRSRLASRPAVRRARIDPWHLDVVERCSPRDQVEARKDEADLAIANGREVVIVELGDIGAVEHVATGGGDVEAADDVHERRLARSARAHDGDELTAFDQQVDAPQRLNLDPAHAVGLGDRLQPDHPPPPIRTPPPPLRTPPLELDTLSVGITTWAPSLNPPVTSVYWSPTTPVSIWVWTCLPLTSRLT